MRATGNFAAALRDYTFALTDFRQDPRVVNKLISHDKRFRVLTHLLHLHAAKVLAGGKGGITYGEMVGLCAQQPDIGLRVLKTMLPLMAFAGHVSVARDDHDHRVKIYTPTSKLFALVRARLAPIIVALQMLQPDVPRAALLRDDPLFLMRALYRIGDSLLEGEPQFNQLPEYTNFLGGREGAAQVVYAVMLADMDATVLPSRGAVAKQFGLSKTQVWSVFSEGERIGYFANDESGTPAATDKLRHHYAAWTALELAVSARVLSPT